MNHFWGVAIYLLVGVAAVLAPDEKVGLEVGAKAPEFKLKDQAGEERSLSTMLKGGPVALVFYRSASW